MIIKFLQSRDSEQERVQSRFPLTGDTRNSAATGECMEAILPHDSSRVVAVHLTKRDYELARLIIPEMSTFDDYEDWLDFRAGTIHGLEIAGFTVELVALDLDKFAAWCRTTSTQPSISARINSLVLWDLTLFVGNRIKIVAQYVA
jgi:hypothetical protein